MNEGPATVVFPRDEHRVLREAISRISEEMSVRIQAAVERWLEGIGRKADPSFYTLCRFNPDFVGSRIVHRYALVPTSMLDRWGDTGWDDIPDEMKLVVNLDLLVTNPSAIADEEGE